MGLDSSLKAALNSSLSTASDSVNRANQTVAVQPKGSKEIAGRDPDEVLIEQNTERLRRVRETELEARPDPARRTLSDDLSRSTIESFVEKGTDFREKVQQIRETTEASLRASSAQRQEESSEIDERRSNSLERDRLYVDRATERTQENVDLVQSQNQKYLDGVAIANVEARLNLERTAGLEANREAAVEAREQILERQAKDQKLRKEENQREIEAIANRLKETIARRNEVEQNLVANSATERREVYEDLQRERYKDVQEVLARLDRAVDKRLEVKQDEVNRLERSDQLKSERAAALRDEDAEDRLERLVREAKDRAERFFANEKFEFKQLKQTVEQGEAQDQEEREVFLEIEAQEVRESEVRVQENLVKSEELEQTLAKQPGFVNESLLESGSGERLFEKGQDTSEDFLVDTSLGVSSLEKQNNLVAKEIERRSAQEEVKETLSEALRLSREAEGRLSEGRINTVAKTRDELSQAPLLGESAVRGNDEFEAPSAAAPNDFARVELGEASPQDFSPTTSLDEIQETKKNAEKQNQSQVANQSEQSLQYGSPTETAQRKLEKGAIANTLIVPDSAVSASAG